MRQRLLLSMHGANAYNKGLCMAGPRRSGAVDLSENLSDCMGKVRVNWVPTQRGRGHELWQVMEGTRALYVCQEGTERDGQRRSRSNWHVGTLGEVAIEKDKL